jgi:transcriptional regulator with XRE-family HTH domain
MPRPNPRDPETNLSAALGETLRDLRIEAGFATQDAWAKATGYAREAISRWETGDTLPGDAAFTDLLDSCRATSRERKTLTRLLRLARKARGVLLESFVPYADAERKAAFLRLWALLLVPGILQVREYALAMFLAADLDADTATEKVEARLDRQAILDGPDPAHVTAIFYESVLYHQVGPPEVMLAQLERLLQLSRRPNVVIQVIRDTGYFPGMEGEFQIASGPDIPDTLVMVTVEDQVTINEAVVRRVAALFEKIRSYALSAEDSRALIVEAITQWKTRQP